MHDYKKFTPAYKRSPRWAQSTKGRGLNTDKRNHRQLLYLETFI